MADERGIDLEISRGFGSADAVTRAVQAGASPPLLVTAADRRADRLDDHDLPPVAVLHLNRFLRSRFVVSSLLD
jgi:hypothetical protein